MHCIQCSYECINNYYCHAVHCTQFFHFCLVKQNASAVKVIVFRKTCEMEMMRDNHLKGHNYAYYKV